MDREPIDVSDVTIDLTGTGGKHRREIDLSSHQDLLYAFDADERVMEALISALPPVRDEITGRHHRAG